MELNPMEKINQCNVVGEGCGPDQQNAHKRPLEEAAHTLSLGYLWEAGTQDLSKAVNTIEAGQDSMAQQGVSRCALERADSSKSPFPFVCLSLNRLLLKQTNAEALRQA